MKSQQKKKIYSNNSLSSLTSQYINDHHIEQCEKGSHQVRQRINVMTNPIAYGAALRTYSWRKNNLSLLETE